MVLLPGHPQHADDKFTIRTRSGKNIPCENTLSSSPQIMQIHAQLLMRERGGLVLRSVDGYPYNCVGMIFASRRSWIEIDHIYELLESDGFVNIQRNDVMPGDVVLYLKDGQPTHVALVVAVQTLGRERSIQVISKWGKDPEFIHFAENVPESLGMPVQFYTDRKIHEHVSI